MKKFGEIKLILKVYLLVLSIFTIFRGILFFVEIDRLDFANTELMTIIQAFVMGVRFDIVISGYILFFPALALFIANITTKKSSLSLIHKIVFYWIFILFSIGFMISAADIPYFGQFFSRFSIGAFEWIENLGFVVSMILQEPKYFAIMIPMVIIIVVFYIFLKRIFNSKELVPRPNIFVNIIISILFLGVMFIGVRGRVEHKSPIRVGTAYFSDNVFLNKLGLNPVFTLMRSYLDSKDSRNTKLELMDDAKAVSLVQKYLGISSDADYNSPIARQITPDSISANKPNIIVVIMESMSAAKMKRHGNPNNITPFLDSLSYESIYFDKIYSAGKHTFNGIFGTLFSYPAMYRRHPMKNIANYDGMSSILSKLGYSTTYFTTHDGQFDNVSGFLRANNFDNIISQKDYPSDKIMTTLGVTDDYLFEYSMPIIDELAESDKPFFVSFMTASDHGPYFIPEYFTPKEGHIKQQIVEYADWSLKQLIKRSSTKAWFDNTIFVFIADHGASMNANYDIALNYHHTPLIIYAPKLLPKQLVSKIGGQIDVFPTIMGLINQPYLNNTLGIDLLKEERPYIIINDDDKFGVLDNNYLLIYKGEKESPKMYSYVEKDRTNIYDSNRSKAKEMLDYGKANLQTYQYLLKSGGTKVE